MFMKVMGSIPARDSDFFLCPMIKLEETMHVHVKISFSRLHV